MTPRRAEAIALAEAMLAGHWARGRIVERLRAAVGRLPFVPRLATQALLAFPEPPRHARDALTDLVEGNAGFRLAQAKRLFRVRRWSFAPPRMGPRRWSVPALETPGALAAWLGVSTDELDWLADRKGLERFARDERLRHYGYRWIAKRTSGTRLVEMPKALLKALQRKVLHEVLAKVPPHEAAHGFHAGRSVATFAAPHAGRALVLRLDLADFFPSIGAARVGAIFRALGYPEPVARLLAGLCTNRAPPPALAARPPAEGERERAARWASNRVLAAPHLPQGAPTSPALANLAAHRLDARLSAIAARLGARYTRYADDLAFSFDSEGARHAGRMAALTAACALDEGLSVRHSKTRRMRQGVRQRLAGVVVNAHPNVPREAFDRLKATLHNCARAGPASQDREGRGGLRARLLGEVAWVAMLNPVRGARLRELYARIDWGA